MFLTFWEQLPNGIIGEKKKWNVLGESFVFLLEKNELIDETNQ